MRVLSVKEVLELQVLVYSLTSKYGQLISTVDDKDKYLVMVDIVTDLNRLKLYPISRRDMCLVVLAVTTSFGYKDSLRGWLKKARVIKKTIAMHKASNELATMLNRIICSGDTETDQYLGWLNAGLSNSTMNFSIRRQD